MLRKKTLVAVCSLRYGGSALSVFFCYYRDSKEAQSQKRIGFENSDQGLMITAAKNTAGTIAVVVFNQEKASKNFQLNLNEKSIDLSIDGQAIQTIIIPKS